MLMYCNKSCNDNINAVLNQTINVLYICYSSPGPQPGFNGAQCIFRGTLFLFYCMFKTNYFDNFQRLIEQHICQLSVFSLFK